MLEVVLTAVAIGRVKLQSNGHHQQTNIQFFTGRLPFLSLISLFYPTRKTKAFKILDMLFTQLLNGDSLP